MSYSYVKAVFPNFEYSNVYNDKLYSNMSTSPTPTVAPAVVPSVVPAVSPFEESNALGSDLKQETLTIRPGDQTHLIEEKTFREPFEQVKEDKDNLHFYNKQIEKFGNGGRVGPAGPIEGHEYHLKHLAKCEFCREMIKKQYNIQTHDQMTELVSHVLLGIFILVLLDIVKNK
jgi:hypothetical protein